MIASAKTGPSRGSLAQFCLEALCIPALMIIHRLCYNASGVLLDQQTKDYGLFLKSPFDDYIPYLSVFIIPYILTWFFGGMVFLYVLVYRTHDLILFRCLYAAVLIASFVEVSIWLIFPASISLRVSMEVLLAGNWLDSITAGVYQNATLWNVFPSAHVGFACMIWLYSKHFAHPKHQWMFFLVFLVICLSVVFIRNHYLIDIAGGVLVTVLVYRFGFLPLMRRKLLENFSSLSVLGFVYGLCAMVMAGTAFIMGDAWSL